MYSAYLFLYFEISADAKQTIAKKTNQALEPRKKEFLVNTLNPGWEPINLLAWIGQ